MPPLIDIQQITYSYPAAKIRVPSVPVLHEVSLQIQAGEYVALLGHNGSGKSTLARHCNALLLPDKGRVLVAGLDSRDEASQRTLRDQVGMIFQHPDNQIIATIVEDDIAWSLAIRGLPVALIRERVEAAMNAVGIAHLRHMPPHKLSGGQRQRLAIAAVLALRPQCIIADEATAALDPLARQEIITLLSQLNRDHGLTIIHVTHLLEEITSAQRVIVMEQGQIILDASPAMILADVERLRTLRLAIPDPLALTAHLRAAGIPIERSAISNQAIVNELLQHTHIDTGSVRT